ncbi:NTP transferase domain-containing protein [Sphingomonas canadensis]|uniref:NTP transferase domain-containing protein n=1 Tax=Sphingomonas canadensis TaxID=1219257 RepID=A0ABW3H6D6_9SPHN|nr:NTP transferase domain-containing protein [Sphingomonas canadensis]MCW3835128.1 NTP transferase domain-containing protein [Sphingomonas canadensis]
MLAPDPSGGEPPAAPGWTAVLLAGQRPGVDALAEHFGVPWKALIPIAGSSMLSRVAHTLLATPEIGRVIVLAQDPDSLMTGDAAWLAAEPRVGKAVGGMGIASSIAALFEAGEVEWPVFVTTADNVLLTREMIAEFLASAQDCDLAVGFGERRTIEASYPATRRTWIKFRGGQYSGANLFAMRNERVASALALWSLVEQDRKKALKLVSRFGPALFLRAVTRTIGLAEAMARAGRRLSLKAKPVVMRAAEAAIDVDKPADHRLAEAILNAREHRAPAI